MTTRSGSLGLITIRMVVHVVFEDKICDPIDLKSIFSAISFIFVLSRRRSGHLTEKFHFLLVCVCQTFAVVRVLTITNISKENRKLNSENKLFEKGTHIVQIFKHRSMDLDSTQNQSIKILKFNQSLIEVELE